MATITIPQHITGSKELVVIPMEEYKKMKEHMLPSLQLKGQAAKRLDKRVAEGIREFRAGKTEPLGSFLKREYRGLYKQYGGRSFFALQKIFSQITTAFAKEG